MSKPKHIIELEITKQSCGCHSTRTFVCSCGWKEQVNEFTSYGEREAIKVAHVLRAEGLMN